MSLTFSKATVLQMLTMQDHLNKVINPGWQSAGFPWHRAIWLEAAEGIEGHGWKWWKTLPDPDLDQFKLELVDIWHFYLSWRIVFDVRPDGTRERPLDMPALADKIIEQWLEEEEGGKADAVDAMEHVARVAILEEAVAFIPAFQQACASVGLTGDELTRRYFQKNVLNLFRQAHGYNLEEGSDDEPYIKIWDGREDNEHLIEVCDALFSGENDSGKDPLSAIWEALGRRYPGVRRPAPAL